MGEVTQDNFFNAALRLTTSLPPHDLLQRLLAIETTVFGRTREIPKGPRRMDLDLLSQTTGFWKWRVRRHFRPEIFAKLSQRVLERYAEATGVPVEKLRGLE